MADEPRLRTAGNCAGAAAVFDSMNAIAQTRLTLLGVALALVPATGCGIDVHEAERGKSVDIKSVLGDVSVRTNVDNADTGLPVYPGAQPLREPGEDQSANVNVASRWFGVRVVAAKYQSDDANDKILEFYRREMNTYGPVTECRGNVDFRGGPGNKRMVCKEQSSSDEVQLAAGTEGRQRVVAVKPRGNGSEFSLVYVNTRG
jgi:carbohydrate-binding DOMON domain-containing protein